MQARERKIMTRDEHLAWAKKRAHEYVDIGELDNAIASMGSDLQKHPDWSSDVVGPLCVIAVFFEKKNGPDAVRRWIDGFN